MGSNLPDLLRVYYQRLFPYNEYYRWLSYGSGQLFSRREFSFTVEDDVYIRFQAFKNLNQLMTEMKRLNPHKIDIGAVYNVPPTEHKYDTKFFPIEKELVFDIDMTDYDEVRTCCSGADICSKCWKYMAIACKVIDSSLREDFGFNHILWVFSGRRGVHCWVCDKRARSLNPAARSAVAEYLHLIRGGAYSKKKVILRHKTHPSIERALGIIKSVFVPMCVIEQNMLGTEENINKFLEIIHTEEEVRADVRSLLNKYSTSEKRWEAFQEYYIKQSQSGSKKWRTRHLIEELMIQYSYPRLDIHVSKTLNHLLKSPYCVHPKTTKVCVPFNPKTVDNFDPHSVPTIQTLINEVDAYDAKELARQKEESVDVRKIKDYKKTAMNKSLHIFLEFLRNLEGSNKEEKTTQNDTQMEF